MADPRYTKGQKFGPYKIDSLLGSGSFAEVWSAWRTGLGGWHAVKILHGNITKRITITRFRTEARAMYELSNAKDSRAELIVRVTDMSDEASETHWMAMERLVGMDLERFCYAHVISLHEALRIARDVALALQFAHQRTISGTLSPIYHRDLKPGNVFRTEAGVVKVGDWGLAHVAHLENEEGGGSVIDHGTVEGLKMGTPGFTAPEQWKDVTNISGSADVYSLGVILAVLVADFYPGPKGELELYNPEVQSEFLAEVPTDLRDIIVAACNVFPKQRPSVDEMVRLLTQAMELHPAETPAFMLRPGFEEPAKVQTPAAPPKTPAASPTLTPAPVPSKAQSVAPVDYGTRLEDPPSYGKWIIGGAVGAVALIVATIMFWPTGQPETPATDPAPIETVAKTETPIVPPTPIPTPPSVEVQPKADPKPETPAVPIPKIEPVPVPKVEAKPKAEPKPVATAPTAKTVVTEPSVSILHAATTVKAGGTVSVEAKVLVPEGVTVQSVKLYWKGSDGGAWQNKAATLSGTLATATIVANTMLGTSVSYYVDVRLEGESKAHKSAVTITTIEP